MSAANGPIGSGPWLNWRIEWNERRYACPARAALTDAIILKMVCRRAPKPPAARGHRPLRNYRQHRLFVAVQHRRYVAKWHPCPEKLRIDERCDRTQCPGRVLNHGDCCVKIHGHGFMHCGPPRGPITQRSEPVGEHLAYHSMPALDQSSHD